MNERKIISDVQLKQELLKLFEQGNTDKGNCKEFIGTKYKIQNQRYYKKFAEALLEWQILREQSTNDAIVKNNIQGLKSGLKAKIERQKALEEMLSPNYRHEVAQLTKDGKVVKYFRVLEPREIVSIHAELSKMDGSYAPEKFANTDTDGNDIIEIGDPAPLFVSAN